MFAPLEQVCVRPVCESVLLAVCLTLHPLGRLVGGFGKG